MRLVLDTNVVISALLWPGTPTRFIDLASEGEAHLFISRALLDELSETLLRPKFARAIAATALDATTLVKHYQRLTHLVTARQLTQQICRDADDDAVLACALAAHAEIIVTGDKDLLVLHPWRDIDILNPAEAVRRAVTGKE